ncbi:MAG: hypothetical protein ABR548_10495 [Actinomycetota bacterium]
MPFAISHSVANTFPNTTPDRFDTGCVDDSDHLRKKVAERLAEGVF